MSKPGLATVVSIAFAAASPAAPSPVVLKESVFDTAPFPECHASTIAEVDGALVAAWFGGTEEKHPDVGIWLARRQNGKWTPPVEIANGKQPDGSRLPCWNPVLFRPKGEPLHLDYKVGPDPSRWWGIEMTSADGGMTWSPPRRLPAGILGPIKNQLVQLADGTIVSPTSDEAHGWRVYFERSTDGGKTWTRGDWINDGKDIQAIQPAILVHRDGRLQALCRNRAGPILQTWSSDGGKTWSKLTPTELPNPNSGIDAVTLKDGRHVLVYNHVPPIAGKWGGPRSPLNVAVSNDGKTWQAAAVLESEPGEFSYPTVIQAADGTVHVTYTWNRKRIKHVVLDAAKLGGPSIRGGAWPSG
ncbi:MAG TPA: sialidase family protein [Gemmataceae bacterium]|jgi:predicted neuraminidase|nr:sialidase family protein [Gemmataceae bacterium]